LLVKRATIAVRSTPMGCGATNAIVRIGDATEKRRVADSVTSVTGASVTMA
jgi:hypothetical protein